MDYEQLYKDALERAKKWYNAPNADKIPTYSNRVIEEIFPELKESEDERIRKALIELVKYSKKSCFEILRDKPFNAVSMDAMLDWLERIYPKSSCISTTVRNDSDITTITDKEAWKGTL